ncbi:E3 ubiquitin-protein ligase CIP8-like [Phalaenopsis equestris]|uniref:E3 ubiquitin-protein ligase CIP8-like n=1 Tax=Phalaenopsis equestris TaxID=78828 RepID=UPI0009E2B154|nr:E3 ubiquitin-protein ligase CIP8-like [Phalaenopsis equestris]XP_020584362.1 E3 ubiquitin-protein ligase CIP8-like [Phalaenopsis equestris]
MADAMNTSHWCFMCRQRVNPVMEPELKCPFCDCGFVEEMAGREAAEYENVGSERPISSWASVMMGMMGNPPRPPQRRRFRRIEDDDDDESDLERELESILWRRRRETDEDVWRARMDEGDDDSDAEHEMESILQRRRQSSAVHQLLRSLRDDFRSESDEPEMEREMEGERENESLILIDSFNEAVILEGSFDTAQNPTNESDDATIGATVGDYFVGPGIEILFQHLAENDPNCYGTPPTQKEAVIALPTVKLQEITKCPVCLEDLEVGMQAKELPCNHKFHKDCISSWLELHSSCPVCRFQLPADESKISSGHVVESSEQGVGSDGGTTERRNGSRNPSSWAFSGTF